MPWLVEQCLARDHTVAAWAISEDWIDVGTPADLARAKGQV
jgi:NDP-sugar pyrophosphorylase family protein